MKMFQSGVIILFRVTNLFWKNIPKEKQRGNHKWSKYVVLWLRDSEIVLYLFL